MPTAHHASPPRRYGMKWKANSCFAASVLQLLASIPNVTSTLVTGLENVDLIEPRRDAVEHLVISLRQCNHNGHPPMQPYTYGEYTDCHQQLRAYVSRVQLPLASFHPSTGHQQDAHELLGLLLSWIFLLMVPITSTDIPCNLDPPLFGTPCQDRYDRLTQLIPYLSNVVKELGCGVLQITSCQCCSYRSQRLEVQAGSWCIDAAHNDGLCGAIRSLFSPRPLDSKATCPQCYKQGCMVLQHSLFVAAKFVFFHVSLFTSHHLGVDKLPCSYLAPLQLCVPMETLSHGAQVLDLALRGVLLHTGETIASGHFITITSRADVWYVCDDESVYAITAPNEWLDANIEYTPYIFLYECTLRDDPSNNRHHVSEPLAPDGQQTTSSWSTSSFVPTSVVSPHRVPDCVQPVSTSSRSVAPHTVCATQPSSTTIHESSRQHSSVSPARSDWVDNDSSSCSSVESLSTSITSSSCTSSSSSSICSDSSDNTDASQTTCSLDGPPETLMGMPALGVLPSALSPAPYAKLEELVEFVSCALSDSPTIPWEFQSRLDEIRNGACSLPPIHCAFRKCEWKGSDSASLTTHLVHTHAPFFSKLGRVVEMGNSGLELRDVYDEAIAFKERQKMPLVGVGIDQRCATEFERRYKDANIMSLVCCICAQIFSVDFGCRGNQPITWQHPFNNRDGGTFCGMDKEQTTRLLGMSTYLAKYGTSNVAMEHQLQASWTLIIPFSSGHVPIIGCGEDRR